MKSALLPAIVAATLAACATADRLSPAEELEATLSDVRLGERTDRVCFKRGIDGFRDAKDRTVVVRRGVNDDYLLVMRSCPQLDRAQLIGFVDGFSGSCLTRNDRVAVSESSFALRGPGQIGPTTCFVDAIYRWNEDAAEEAPVASDPLD